MNADSKNISKLIKNLISSCTAMVDRAINTHPDAYKNEFEEDITRSLEFTPALKLEKHPLSVCCVEHIQRHEEGKGWVAFTGVHFEEDESEEPRKLSELDSLLMAEVAIIVHADLEKRLAEEAAKIEALSDNQKAFIEAAEENGLKWKWYSGRAMYGKECPSVVVDCVYEFAHEGVEFLTDSMGKRIVFYARY